MPPYLTCPDCDQNSVSGCSIAEGCIQFGTRARSRSHLVTMHQAKGEPSPKSSMGQIRERLKSELLDLMSISRGLKSEQFDRRKYHCHFVSVVVGAIIGYFQGADVIICLFLGGG